MIHLQLPYYKQIQNSWLTLFKSADYFDSNKSKMWEFHKL